MGGTTIDLDRAPQAAVRLLALSHLNEARRAARRLPSPEHLHDFRVALRRLRTLIRVYNSLLADSVRKKDRRRLRDLGRCSSGRRDAQVQLELLVSLRASSEPNAAARLVGEHLRKRVSKSEAVPIALVKDFRKLNRQLRRRLRRYRESIGPSDFSESPTFHAVAVGAAQDLANRLSDALSRINSNDDIQALHAARLDAKGLRYTLEPLKPISSAIADAVLALSRLQDVLGEARDGAGLHSVIMAERMKADESLAAEFDALASRLHEYLTERYAELQKLWLDGNSAWFFQGLQRAFATISPVAVLQ